MFIHNIGFTRKVAEISKDLHFVYFEKTGAPLHLQFLFNYGSRLLPSETSGLAHFTEHMLLTGTEKYPNVHALATFIDSYGGYYNAFTGSENLGIDVAIGDPKDYAVSVEFLEQTILKPTLLENVLESTKNTIIHEITDSYSDPARYVWELWRELFFQETPLSHSVLGTKDEVSQYKIDQIQKSYKKMINAQSKIIVGAGGTRFELLEKVLRDTFNDSASTPIKTEILDNKNSKKVLTRYYGDTDSVHLIIGFRTVPFGHRDLLPLVLWKNILATSRSSRLFQKLRYELGLIYSVGAKQYTFNDAGTFIVKTSTSKLHFKKVIEEIRNEFNRINKGVITESELYDVKQRVIKSKQISIQTVKSLVDFHAQQNMFDIDWTVDSYINDLQQIKLSDMKSVGEKYFNIDSMLTVAAGNCNDEELV